MHTYQEHVKGDPWFCQIFLCRKILRFGCRKVEWGVHVVSHHLGVQNFTRVPASAEGKWENGESLWCVCLLANTLKAAGAGGDQRWSRVWWGGLTQAGSRLLGVGSCFDQCWEVEKGEALLHFPFRCGCQVELAFGHLDIFELKPGCRPTYEVPGRQSPVSVVRITWLMPTSFPNNPVSCLPVSRWRVEIKWLE